MQAEIAGMQNEEWSRNVARSLGMIPKSYMDGWVYEGPDASVGIFGESWYHDDCAGHDPGSGDLIECDVEVRRTGAVGEGVNRFTLWAYRVHCVSCGQALRWIERDWDPIYPEDAI